MKRLRRDQHLLSSIILLAASFLDTAACQTSRGDLQMSAHIQKVSTNRISDNPRKFLFQNAFIFIYTAGLVFVAQVSLIVPSSITYFGVMCGSLMCALLDSMDSGTVILVVMARGSQLWLMGSEHWLSSCARVLVAPRHEGSSCVRDRTHTHCIAKWIFNH